MKDWTSVPVRHTTLAALRAHGACEDRYAHLIKALGPDFGDETPLSLARILEENGFNDALWALRTCPRLAAYVAALFAEHVLLLREAPAPADDRPALAIAPARDAAWAAWAAAWAAAGDTAWAAGDAAWAAGNDAARDAAWAAWAAARDAAWAARNAAARDAGNDAARDAAWAAAGDAEREWQVAALRACLANWE